MLNTTTVRSVALAATLGLGAFALPANAAPLSASTTTLAIAGEAASDAGIIKAGHRDRRYKRRHHRGNDAAGAAVAAGIIGLTVGALIASQPRVYAEPQVRYERHYVPQRRYYRDYRAQHYEPVRSYRHYAPEPYTGEWYRYCASKYRSFDAASGTFMSYSGVRKLCR